MKTIAYASLYFDKLEMLNYFSISQIIALLIFGSVSGLVGVLSSWLRIVFLIDVLSHTAILGIGMSKILDISSLGINPSALILITNLIIAFIVFKSKKVNDMLVVISQVAVAIGMILLSFTDSHNHMHYFCGHIHNIQQFDVILIFIYSFAMLISFLCQKKGIFLTMVSEELSAIQGYNAFTIKLFSIFFIVIIVTESTKIAGVLSASSIFLIPSAFAFSSTGVSMIISSIISLSSILATIITVENFHLPIGPTIALFSFVISIIFKLTYVIKQKF